jgi:hypothetical protein
VFRKKKDHYRQEKRGPHDPEADAATGLTIRGPQYFQKSQPQDRIPDHACDSSGQHFGAQYLMRSRIHAQYSSD